MIRITCPYCFEEFDDESVHFRSEKIYKGDSPLKKFSDSLEVFEQYLKRLPEKENKDKDDEYYSHNANEIRKSFREWQLFSPQTDKKYLEFWNRYGGKTTEVNPSDDTFGVKSQERPIISTDNLNKYEIAHELLYDFLDNETKFAAGLQMGDSITRRRVCPGCHNPLPEGYGKYPVKFIVLVGITKAGKTVFLSQLLKRMSKYMAKVGMSADENSASIQNFIRQNPVKAENPLPAPTPAYSFQQPLFYDLITDTKGDNIQRETIVIYDVSGESYTNPETVTNFAKFVKHADGVILLIPPSQLTTVEEITGEESEGEPARVLNTIKDAISKNGMEQKVSLPIAVCISQWDRLMKENIKDVFDEELRNRMLDEVAGLKGNDGFYKKEFNGSSYNPIGIGLDKFFMSDNEIAFAQYLKAHYNNYAWFAFSALGCDVTEFKKTDDSTGEETTYYGPVGPISPKHIEDPLLWLLYRFGFIGTNERVFNPGMPPVICPVCGSADVTIKDHISIQEVEPVKKGFLGIGKKEAETIEYDTICNKCDHKWCRNKE